MSTEQIVNRVDQGQFYEIEAPKPEPIVKEQEIADTLSSISAVPSNVDMSTLALDEHYVNQAEPEELPNVTTGLDVSDTQQGSLDELVKSFIKSRSESSFAEFRTQVISAFKHLGLDTKKFFPE
jgi:hypothetical protein